MTAPTAKPPAIILGGDANALSVARDLGRAGVPVYMLAAPDASAGHSRYCRVIELNDPRPWEDAWAAYLLGPESDHLRGAVVLTCSDAGLQVLTRHREALLAKYLLDDSNPVAQIEMLDKLTTYKHARAAGVPTPNFWEISSREQVEAVRDQLGYPLMIKPRLSHVFEQHFGRKHMIVDSFDALTSVLDRIASSGVDVLLMEHVPGGDELLCSYYTYLDEHGEPMWHFSKRIIRRYPAGMGGACYHITDWIPELVEPSNRLFRQVGLRGLANVEYKRDPRDGQYKIIECNARFTASNCLVSAAGFKLAVFVYNRLVGLPLPHMKEYNTRLRLWDPMRDVMAFLERRRSGELTLLAWLGGLMHRQTFPFFSWTDPMPAARRLVGAIFRKRAKRA